MTIIFTIFTLSRVLLSTQTQSSSVVTDRFVHCLNNRSDPSFPITGLIYTQDNSSFPSVLQAYIQNLRFNKSTTPKPILVITASHVSHIQAVVVCGKEHGLLMKTRSGGHDYEGLSYVTNTNLPFFIVDMFNLRSINVSVEDETAWVQAGATRGEVYYRIAEKSNQLGFPAGVCPTVGVGGHFSGGGYVADKLDKDLFLRMRFEVVNDTNGEKTIRALFITLYLGNSTNLVAILNKDFPELGLLKSDCIEMSWVESVVFYTEFPLGTPTKVLLSRKPQILKPFKIKSDYLQEPISKKGFELIFEKMKELENQVLTFNPYGGRMSEISEFAKPFPHRSGNIAKIQYVSYWDELGDEAAKRYLNFTRLMYEYMTPFVSKNPREAFLNYRDLDIGKNSRGKNAGLVYGHKYFKEANYKRLTSIKTRVDPQNFFKNERSVPTLSILVGKIDDTDLGGDTNHTNGWLHDTETDHNCQHTNSHDRLKSIIREEMQIEVMSAKRGSSSQEAFLETWFKRSNLEITKLKEDFNEFENLGSNFSFVEAREKLEKTTSEYDSVAVLQMLETTRHVSSGMQIWRWARDA
ncbi:berberine bridge enzyme-like protein 8 [Tanacetum coccineum]